MPKPKMKKITIEVTPQAYAILQTLFDIGIFGTTIEEMCERIVCKWIWESMNNDQHKDSH